MTNFKILTSERSQVVLYPQLSPFNWNRKIWKEAAASPELGSYSVISLGFGLHSEK